MIYAILTGQGTLSTLLKHKKPDIDVDKIETDWWTGLEVQMDGVRGVARVEKRLQLAQKLITEPEETLNKCFVQYLIEKHKFSKLSYKECQVIP